mmetsp:Transcript_120410/g.239637  ORF Transcript_120410/g.239637 Transcript_120410/m.239637 type:complete len:144 (+) Transcript_120410:139-570(+)|eukprot:CAMPEP_0172706424 /NCGR_PEP_ID=MMETSP1074-20121228/45992_1 /TAXON_ID=2916 /ORGANISM="Ceratium fusus, Strain PA161109" /LENGTH=143 /DNA_ID=CAMNT_0013528997 /DNA_START=129 /DNA_END=560 /DNA_ORIENTATION=-
MGNTADCCSNKETDHFETHDGHRRDVPNALLETPEYVRHAGPGPTPLPLATRSNGRSTDFKVIIDRSSGTRLGVDVDHLDGKTLRIDAITGGLAEKWNSEHPDRPVMQGDRIIEVNGCYGDVGHLLEECKKQKLLEITIRRGQ